MSEKMKRCLDDMRKAYKRHQLVRFHNAKLRFREEALKMAMNMLREAK